MQVKTISKVIKNKLTDWIETINDESLKKSLYDNVLVSGGSITSMLLNEPVNDYDIYINDIDVLKNLVKYYTKDFTSLEIIDGRNIGECDESDSKRSVALRTTKKDQIKIHMDNTGGMRVNEHLSNDRGESYAGPKYYPIFFSPNAISLSDDIQIVCRFHGDNEQIHKTFDYIHATNYFTFKEGLITNKRALESILTKQLFYQGSLYPLTSIIRMKKFLKRGWSISAGEMLKMMFQVSKIDLTNPDILEEQLIGVDVAYFGLLIEILRGANKETISSSYIIAIIDRVFNSNDQETDDL